MSTADEALAHSCLARLSDDEWDLVIGHLLAFRQASTFRGCWPGWVFKNGEHGLGYYIDRQPAEYAMVRLTAVCQATRRRTQPRLVTLARKQLQASAQIPPPFGSAGARYLVECALRDSRHLSSGVMSRNVSKRLADDAYVSRNLAKFLMMRTSVERDPTDYSLVAFARQHLVPAMHFARSIMPAGEQICVPDQPHLKLHLPVRADVEPMAVAISKFLIVEEALERWQHRRENGTELPF